MFTSLHAVVLGIVEGVTEFLPISSTGHLILTAHVLKISQTEFVKSFEIAIQLGAICAVVVLYGKKLLLQVEVLKRVCVAFVPTAVVGLVFYKFIKTYLIGNASVVLWSFFLGGAALIVFELLYKEKADATTDATALSYRQSFFIGVCQSVAVIPGVSRAAATIVGGLIAGIRRETIIEFSFLLAIPTMAAATGLDLLKNASAFSSNEFGTLTVGFIVSFLAALLAVRWLLAFIKTHNFISFGIYRIAVALAFWFLV